MEFCIIKKCSSCKSKIVPKITRVGKFDKYSCPVCGVNLKGLEIKGPVGLVFSIVFSILFIAIGVNYFFLYGGVTPDKLNIIETTVQNKHCSSSYRSSDSLYITFTGIQKEVFVQPLIYCDDLLNTLVPNQKVKLWLESSQSTIKLWGLQSNGQKLIWPTSGFVNTKNFNPFSVMLFILGFSLGKKSFYFIRRKTT